MRRARVIDSIRLQNFRAIEDLSIELADVTHLLGGEGSGKTSVLDALRLVAGLHRRGIEEMTLGSGRVDGHARLDAEGDEVVPLESTITLSGPIPGDVAPGWKSWTYRLTLPQSIYRGHGYLDERLTAAAEDADVADHPVIETVREAACRRTTCRNAGAPEDEAVQVNIGYGYSALAGEHADDAIAEYVRELLACRLATDVPATGPATEEALENAWAARTTGAGGSVKLDDIERELHAGRSRLRRIIEGPAGPAFVDRHGVPCGFRTLSERQRQDIGLACATARARQDPRPRLFLVDAQAWTGHHGDDAVTAARLAEAGQVLVDGPGLHGATRDDAVWQLSRTTSGCVHAAPRRGRNGGSSMSPS